MRPTNQEKLKEYMNNEQSDKLNVMKTKYGIRIEYSLKVQKLKFELWTESNVERMPYFWGFIEIEMPVQC